MLVACLIALGIIALVGAFILPWLLVREGQKEIVGLVCFCSAIAGLAALYGLNGESATYGPLMWLFAACTAFGLLYALNCGLPLWLTRKSGKK
ncbi:cobalamin biosynthesis protein CbiX [Escherichia coli]